MTISAHLNNSASLQRCLTCPQRETGLCGSMGPQELAALVRASRPRRFRAGELLDNGDDRMVGIVTRGVLRLVRHRADGRTGMFGFVLPGEVAGLRLVPLGLFALEAATDGTLCQFDPTAFDGLCARYPAIERHFADAAGETMRWLTFQLAASGGLSVTGRIALFLLTLPMRTRKPGDPCLVEVPIERRDLAALLDTTVETISRATRAMHEGGLIGIETPRRFRLRDVASLQRLAGVDEAELAAIAIRRQVPGCACRAAVHG